MSCWCDTGDQTRPRPHTSPPQRAKVWLYVLDEPEVSLRGLCVHVLHTHADHILSPHSVDRVIVRPSELYIYIYYISTTTSNHSFINW